MTLKDMTNEEMILAYQQTQDDFLFTEIYENNKRMIKGIVGKLKEHDQIKFSYEDLEAVANIGLWEAVKHWNPERGAFSTLAYKTIRHKIYSYTKTIKADKNVAKLNFCHLPMDGKAFKNDIDGLTFSDIISYEDDYGIPSVDGLIRQEEMERIKLIRTILNDKENDIIDKVSSGMTQDMIGKEYGVTRQNISAKVKSIRNKIAKFTQEIECDLVG